MSLHGDFKYDSIQNTNEELKKLEIKVTERCKQILQTGRLIVIGYAGNDDSIMSLLEQGLSNGLFPNGIIWCKKRGSEVNERVASFMGKACLENKNSAIAEIDGFDVLLYRIYRTKELINEIIEEQYNLKEGSNAPIIFNAKKVQNEFIKTNAFMQLEIPDKCLTFETDIKSWKDLNEIRKDNCIIAGLHNGKIISLSNEDTLLKVFTSHIKSKISETPFMPPILKDDNSVEMGLCYDILSYDLVNNKNLIKVGKRRFYDPNRISTDKKYYEAIEIRLTFVEQSICLTIMIDKKTMSRVKYKKTCADCDGREVKQEDIVKGFEYEEGKYVIFEESDFEKIKSKKDKNITIEKFIDLSQVDSLYFDKPYYVVPTGAEKAFTVLLKAMEEENKAAVAKTVLGTKENLILIRAKDGQMLLNTLFFEEEVTKNPAKEIKEEGNEQELKMAKALIEGMSGDFNPEEYKDEYRAKIQEAIEQKIAGKEIIAPKEKEEGTVANLMDALKKSLELATGGNKKTKKKA